tara:strand:+ start:6735 stop:7613 length:879 start_codon:yes stop_codon:yes gene_type:complete
MGSPPTSKNPLVSVVLTTFNRKKFLTRALYSVFEQTLVPEQVIVVDDGSTDNTSRDLPSSFPSVHWLEQENRGVASARNLGIRHARGRWVALLDSDDEWESTKIESQLNRFGDKCDAIASHTNEKWIRSGNQVMPPKYLDKSSANLFERSLRHCLISASSIILHHRIFQEVGYFDESFPVCEDYDFWLRLLQRADPMLVDEELVIKHGGHPDQLSASTWGLDRYRVKSMEKLLLNPNLTQTRKPAVWEELATKCEILEKGFAKRKKVREAREYALKKERALSLLGKVKESAQ